MHNKNSNIQRMSSNVVKCYTIQAPVTYFSFDFDQICKKLHAGAFLRHFIEYALLKGSGVLTPVWGQGEAMWQKMVVGHSKGLT